MIVNEPQETVAPTLPVAKHRARFERIADRLDQVRSTIAAFKLAAKADSFERPAAYWPNLMRSLETLLPPDEDVERFGQSVFEEMQRNAPARLRPVPPPKQG